MIKNINDTKIFSEKYYSFLVSEFGFSMPTEKWASYEFHIEYVKDNIEIDIGVVADGSSMPFVTLTDHSKPSDFDMTLTPSNYFSIESLEENTELRNIRQIRNERYSPKVNMSVKNFNPDNFKEAFQQLETDYEKWGRTELESILKESAEIIKRNKQILFGDLTIFPQREQQKEIHLDLYEKSDNGAKQIKQEKFKSVSDLFSFFKNKKGSKK